MVHTSVQEQEVLCKYCVNLQFDKTSYDFRDGLTIDLQVGDHFMWSSVFRIHVQVRLFALAGLMDWFRAAGASPLGL